MIAPQHCDVIWRARWIALLIIATLLIELAGCVPSEPAVYPLSGRVSYLGRPVVEGQVLLFPLEDLSQNPAVCVVGDGGNFSGLATAGKKRVVIYAGIRAEGMTYPQGKEPADGIPAKYGTKQSGLEVEVMPGDTNRFDFALARQES